MEIGNLFGQNKDTSKKELFLAIQIQEDLVKTAVWEIIDQQPQVLAYGPVNSWTDEDSLLIATDASLAQALAGIEEDVSRVIFGLPESWLKGDTISPDFSPLIKKLITQLELKPIGFVTTTEAVIQFLKSSEGVPPTVIVVELGLSKANLTITRTGEIVGREEVIRSDDLAKDVAEGLTRLSLDSLPARFIVINGSSTEAEQQLTSYSWQDDFPFLHLPKVEVPPVNFSIQAVAISGGTEAARALGIPSATQSLDTSLPPQVPDSPSPSTARPTLVSAADFGFVTHSDSEDTSTPESKEEEVTEEPKTSSSPQITPSFSRPQFKLPSLRIPHFTLPQLSLPKSRLTLLLFALPPLLLIIAAVIFYRLKSDAQVTVFVTSQKLNKTLSLSIASQASSDLPTLIATSDTIELEKQDSLSTTGEATVGDKATGEVTIFNKTDSPKTLDKGSVLSTSSNLKFILNDSTTIASRSAQEQDGGVNIVYGKTTAKVTASSIGVDGNVPADTTFAVATFPSSSLDAKSNSAFTGGTSRTVKAVSKADRDKLLAQVLEALKADAATKLNSATSEEKVVAGSDLKVIDQNFDKAVGEEANTLKLTVKAQVPLLRYQSSQLMDVLRPLLQSSIPSGYTLNPDATQISISNTEKDAGKDSFTASVNVATVLIPDIPVSDFTNKLTSLPIAKANSLLQTISGYQKAKIIITPPLPILSTYLPSNPQHIHFSIQTLD